MTVAPALPFRYVSSLILMVVCRIGTEQSGSDRLLSSIRACLFLLSVPPQSAVLLMKTSVVDAADDNICDSLQHHRCEPLKDTGGWEEMRTLLHSREKT